MSYLRNFVFKKKLGHNEASSERTEASSETCNQGINKISEKSKTTQNNKVTCDIIVEFQRLFFSV